MGSMFTQLPSDWEEAQPILEQILQVNAGTLLKVAGTTNKRPSPPQSIGGTVDQQQVTLTWTMPDASSDITGWRVYKDNENNMIQSVKDPNTLQAIIKVAVTTAVGFWISSVNAAGRESYKVQAIATPKGINLALGTGKVALDTQVADGPVNFGRTPVSNYGPATPSGKVTGFQVLTNPDFQNGITNYNVYDNNASGSVGISLVADTAAPGGMGQKLKIVESSVGAGPVPGLGGFYYAPVSIDTGANAADAYHVGDTYVVDLVANIPTGYTLNFTNNSLGTGGFATWLSSQAGTGNWQHYIVRVVIGPSASADAFPFFYLTGTDGVTWYVGQLTIIDIDQPHRYGGRVTSVGGDGTKVDWSTGISAAGYGNIVHAGNIRTYLSGTPFWGFYGSPAHPVETFAGAQTYRGTGAAPYLGMNDTNASGVEGFFTSGNNAAGTINVQYGGNIYASLPSGNKWGFYGSPSIPVHAFASGNIIRAHGAVSAISAFDTQASGRSFAFVSGDAAGIGSIDDQTAAASRTNLNSFPSWGFYGTPSNSADVDILGGSAENAVLRSQVNGSGPWSRLNVNTATGGKTAAEFWGSATLLQTQERTGGTASHVTDFSNSRFGFFASPSTNFDVQLSGSSGSQYGRINNSTTGSNTGWIAQNTGTSGREYGFLSAFPAAANQTVYDFTAGVQRTVMDASGNQDFGGSASPTTLSAGGTAFADLSGNLKLKNISQATGGAGSSTSSPSYSVVPSVTTTITTKGNKVLIIATCSLLYNTSGTADFGIFRDNAQQSGDVINTGATNDEKTVTLAWLDSPTAASHTYDLRWKSISSTQISTIGTPSIQVTELG